MSVSSIPNRTEAEEAIIQAAQEHLEFSSDDEDRKSALEKLMVTGLPHRRIEAYRYTDLKSKLRQLPPLPEPLQDKDYSSISTDLPPSDGCRLVFVDGNFAENVSDHLPDGITLDFKRRYGGNANDPISQLSAVLSSGTFFLSVDAGVKVTAPLTLIHLSSSQDAARRSHSCVVLDVGEGAEIAFAERHCGGEAGGLNTLDVCITVASNAKVWHAILQGYEPGFMHLGSRNIDIQAGGHYQQCVIQHGAGLSRIENHAAFSGEAAYGEFLGLMLGKENQHFDCSLFLNHKHEGCSSNTAYRSLADGRSSAIFQGKIVVHEGAQKTDAQMLSKGFFLSPDAEVVNKPELEIFADDVVCSHGATSGQLDPSALFYLQSRGINIERAMRLLSYGVTREITAGVSHDYLRRELELEIVDWFGADEDLLEEYL